MSPQVARFETRDPEALFAPGELSAFFRRGVRGLRRRWLGALLLFLLSVGAAALAVRVWPRSFRASATVFALPPDDAPGSAHGPAGHTSGLTRGAAQTVLTRASLRQMVRALHLTPSWVASRVGPAGWLDRRLVQLGLSSELTPEDAAVKALSERLTLKVDGEEITLTATWPDARLAQAIVALAERRLFESRRAIELAPLEAKAKTLKTQAETDARRVDRALAGLARTLQKKHDGAKASSVTGLQAEGRFRDLPDPRLSQLRRKLIARRREIADLEGVQQRRLADLSATLAEERATLGPQNPRVLETEASLSALKVEGQKLQRLKDGEQALLAQYVAAGGNARELSADPAQLWSPELKDDPTLSFRKAELSLELTRLEEVRSEALDAQVALSAAKAAFGGRYAELEAPRLPTHPCAPRRTLCYLGGLLAGLLLAFFHAYRASPEPSGVLRQPPAVGVPLR